MYLVEKDCGAKNDIRYLPVDQSGWSGNHHHHTQSELLELGENIGQIAGLAAIQDSTIILNVMKCQKRSDLMNEVVRNYFWRNFCRTTDKSVANLCDDLALRAYPSRELRDRLTPWAQYAKYGSTQPNAK